MILKTVADEKIAEEALHDVFLKIWNQIEHYDARKGTIFTWMYRIARNYAIDVRRSKNFKAQDKSNQLDNYVNVFESTDYAFDDNDLSEFLKQTGVECNNLVRKNFFMGFSHAEIAQNDNMPLGTVKTKLRNCLKKLRELLSKELG